MPDGPRGSNLRHASTRRWWLSAPATAERERGSEAGAGFASNRQETPVASYSSRRSRSSCWPVTSAKDVEVLVAVENREARQLGGRRDQEIGHSRARCPRSASSCWTSTARSSMAGVRYSTGLEASGGRRRPARSSSPVRALYPISSRVTVLTRTGPASIRSAHVCPSTASPRRDEDGHGEIGHEGAPGRGTHPTAHRRPEPSTPRMSRRTSMRLRVRRDVHSRHVEDRARP
jgi:hypothetical protein